MTPIFVDRVDITAELRTKIQSRERTLVILLYSETGIGKSTLADKLIHMSTPHDKSALSISVRMNPINNAGSTSNNDYAIAIFKEIYSFFSKKNYESGNVDAETYRNFNFKNYIANAKNPKIKKHLLEFVNEKFIKTELVAGDIVRDALDILFQRIFKIGIFDEDTIVEELEKNIMVVNDYIEYVLGGIESYINIDNLQNIDSFSHKYLIDWIAGAPTRKNVFILEYTLSGKDDTAFARFVDTMNIANVELVKVGLSKLKESDVVEIAMTALPEKSKDETFINNVRAHYLGESNGNLFEIEKYLLTYNFLKQDIKDNALRQGLLRLGRNEKFLLSIIILHGGKILDHIFKSIIKQSDLYYLEEELETAISESEFVKKEKDYFILEHASIIDIWKKCDSLKKETAYYVAYKCCLEYYRQIFDTKNFFSVSHEKCIAMLLDLYAEFEPGELVGLLDSLDEISISALSPQEVWKKLSTIYENIKLFANKFEEEIYHVIRICLQCELFEKAQYCLENVQSPQFHTGTKYTLYRCLIYSFRERHTEVLTYTKDKLSKFTLEVDRYLYLFQIIALRSQNRNRELASLVLYLRSNNIFQSGYTLGCFLRLAEVYENRTDAIPYLRQSIEVFEGVGDDEQASKSRISLSFLLAVTGDMQAALEESGQAEKFLEASIQNRCIFNVNKAALLLLSAEYSDTVWDLLSEAELLTNTVFNRVAIYINKLVYCMERDDFESGDICAERLINVIQGEYDRHILAIGAYDLYLYYKRTRREKTAEHFYGIAYKYRSYCCTLHARLEPSEEQDPSFAFLLSKPWHVCFLSYWEVDIKLG